ncbi:Protein of unknown function [Rhizobiales bacterium GAS113]|nr:Protein of unknown function [Rhizobiales bacterium GAS113]
MRGRILFVAGLLVMGLSELAFAQEFPTDADNIPRREYSPYVTLRFPNRVLWGDTHLHTSFSFDAGFGTTLGPEEAYRYARGEEVVSSTGIRARLSRPLDFLVVSDHAEYIGLPDMLRAGDPNLLATETGARWYKMIRAGGREAATAGIEAVLAIFQRKELYKDERITRSIWERVTAIATKYNEPGRFTAFNGFEWTSAPGPGNNLHRVVIFRDGAERANQILPFSAFDSENPEDLWRYLASYEQKAGGQALAIPHNGNLSNGRMFALADLMGNPLTRQYAENRARWEPLAEVTQTKGDGETHPSLSGQDEFANFERWDFGNMFNPVVPKQKEMLQYEYARSALGLGLKLEAKLGVNPFKFGMIGSTDSHTALSSFDQDNFFGKLPSSEPSPERWNEVFLLNADKTPAASGWQIQAAGIAGVWARENTREAIFDAMKRKEVYASTGPRITVRVFAGWDFQANEVERPDFALQGYTRGVPMGGTLAKPPAGDAAPTFMVRTLRDPDGANLDRVQIIKGWLDEKDDLHERIFDVAVSDGRKIGTEGRCLTPVGNTVDVPNATYTNTIGGALLSGWWKDPDFNPQQRAFYYIRVIQIPTPRWTAYDAKRFGVKMPDYVPMIVAERAYTSPIWYSP